MERIWEQRMIKNKIDQNLLNEACVKAFISLEEIDAGIQSIRDRIRKNTDFGVNANPVIDSQSRKASVDVDESTGGWFANQRINEVFRDD